MLTRAVNFLLIFLLAVCAIAAEPRNPFSDPIYGFSKAIVPILRDFEKARIETNLRGFIARGDSFPGFHASDEVPSEDGIYLSVAVRDPGDVPGFSDRTGKHGVLTNRSICLPVSKGGDSAMIIEFDYGSKVPTDVIQAINTSIKCIVASTHRRNKR